VGKDDQQGNRYGKGPVDGLFFIKDEQDQYREGDTGQDGTQGHKPREVKTEQEDAYAVYGHDRLDREDHPEQGGHAFPATEIGPDREDMADHGSQPETYHEVGAVPLAVHIERKKNIQARGQHALQHVGRHNDRTPAGTQHPERIGGSGVAAAVVTDIDGEEIAADPDRRRYGTDQICEKK